MMRRGLSSRTLSSRTGQAFVELTVCLLVLVTLFIGVVTYHRLAVTQHHVRRDARTEAGVAALRRGPEGWVNAPLAPESRTHIMHRVNAHNRLEDVQMPLQSKLPSSAYTLASRDLPEAELGMTTVAKEKIIPLHSIFSNLINGRDTVTIREHVTFPSTTNLWN